MAPRDLKIPAQRHPEKQRRADAPQPKKPDWIRVKAPTSEGYKQTRDIMREHKLVTVCEEAGCPNVGECWGQGHATMMIMGEVCTRACTFCNIATGRPPEALDVFEPGRVADAVKKLGLNHVVVTSVDRDDVEDGGAAHFAQTIRAIRKQSPDTTIEILTMRAADIDFLTIGQYLQPTPKHHAVDRFVTPEEFASYEKMAYNKGFLMVSATPLTRSSYHAGDDFARLRAARDKKLGRA